MLYSINSNYQCYQSLSQNKNLAQNVNSTSPKQSTGLSKENSTQNTGLTKQMAQNATQSDKTTNTENLVLDKSQAVSKVLGYGVDSDGYFTSDFNEATGLPQDYKIYAKGALELVNHLNEKSGYFTNVDLARSLGNAYKIFSQIVDDANIQSFTKDDLATLPSGFKYDTKNLKVLATYDAKQMQGLFDYSAPSGEKLVTLFASRNLNDFMNSIPAQDIFASANDTNFNADISKAQYTNEDGSITKGGVFMAFFTSLGVGSFMKGDTTINGKLAGYDDFISGTQIRELEEFMANNPISHLSDDEDYGIQLARIINLPRQDLSIEEFKEKWLELKAKSDKAKEAIQTNATASSTNSSNGAKVENTDDSEEKDKKSFTPIQAESSRETYKDLSGAKNLELAKMEQMKAMLEILFNQKSNSSSTYKELQKFVSSGSSGIDLKA